MEDNLLAMATSTLLTPYGLDEAALARVLGQMTTHEVDFSDLYFQYSRSEGWSLEEGVVKSGSFHIEQGVGIRAISGEKTAFAYSDDIHLEALEQAVRVTRAIGRSGQSASSPVLGRSQRLKTPLYLPHDPLASLADGDKVQLLERLEALARRVDPRVVQVMASLAGEYEVVLVARSDGRLQADVRPLVRVSVQVIAEQGGVKEQGSAGGGGRFGYAYFTDAVLESYARQAVHQALTNLEARPAPAGSMTVVLGSGWPGILLHEAIGHGLEGDFNRKGTSAFSGRIGQKVAAAGVTVVDDGTLVNRRGSLQWDDEGHPTQCTTLIEEGILRGYLQDGLNARLMGMAPTGNGRRESFAHLPLPRMTNTCMMNGAHDPEEIIASIDRGLYAVNFGGGQVDITSGKFVFSTSEAWWIENGKRCYPVKGATLIGNGPDVLTRVSMIGNDMALDPGEGGCRPKSNLPHTGVQIYSQEGGGTK
ncbi:MAG: metalloprotease TldD [Ferrovum sp.]|nr:metalloprotease TldD [Ferrovum sp.]